MPRDSVHLTDWLDHASIQAAGVTHVEIQTFVIHRVARTVVFQHPTSRVTWPEMELGEAPVLKTFLALKPFVWGRVTGPVVFHAGVIDSTGAETTILEHVLDPRNREEDRAWVPVEVSLEKWRGQRVRLVLETRGQPKPVSYGWAGWGDPLLCDAVAAATRRAGPRASIKSGKTDRPPDIFLVTCDALRADHLGCYGAPEGATPNLDAFAAESLRVCHARTPSDATLASFACLLTGRLPQETKVTAEWGEFPAHLPSLPVTLAGAGYQTLLASSELELGAPTAGVARLFTDNIPCLGNPAQHSSLTARRVIARLRAIDVERPLFVWMQLFEPHPPDIPEPMFVPGYEGDPSQPNSPETVRAIHGIESALDLDTSRAALAAGRIPPALLHRLEETVRSFQGDLMHGPDLVSHLKALGPAAWNGMELPGFLKWLAHELKHTRKSKGAAHPSLLLWLRNLDALLTEAETDLLSWLRGIEDFNYPKALYAASVKSVDHAFGQLVTALHELGRYENSVIVFTSPHGEFFHVPPLTFEHHALHEIALRVPLLIKPPASSGIHAGLVPGPIQLDELPATLLDYAGVSAAGAMRAERSRRGALEGREAAAPADLGVSVSMQGLAACLFRAPFKLVRFHEDGLAWPWLPDGRTFQRGETALFHGEPLLDDTRDVSEEHPAVVAGMAAELERLAPLEAFAHASLEPARFEPIGEGVPTSEASSAPDTRVSDAHRRFLDLLREEDLPAAMKPSDVARLVALELHQAALERDLRDAEDRRSAAERLHRVEAMRLRELRRETQRLRKDFKQLTRWLDQLGTAITRLYRTRRWRMGAWFRMLRKRGETDGFPAVDTILHRFAEWRKGAQVDGRDLHAGGFSYVHWLQSERPDERRQRDMKLQLEHLQKRPHFGLIMAIPATATPQHVAEAVSSVVNQSYDGWQLWLFRASAELRAGLPQDHRIRVLDTPSLPSDVTHFAAVGSEDLLEPSALTEVAIRLGSTSWPELLYTDEDEIGPSGVFANPFFKPAWSPETLESCHYVGSLSVYDRKVFDALQADATWLAPDRVYDTLLRASECPGFRADRLPRLLYHRRPPVAAERAVLQQAERQALADAIQRRDDVAEVRLIPDTGMFRVLRPVWKQEKVVILIPTRDRLALLRRAVESLEKKTSYRNYEIVIINNESRDPETLAWLERSGHEVFDFPGPFNYAAMHNAAVRATNAPWLMFLNNDTEVIEPHWLTAMAEHVQRPEIGAVGAKLLFPDGTVQHAGVVLGIQDRAAHAFANLRPEDLSARAQLQMVRNYSAVTAACMMMRRDVYERIGGMDAERFPVAYNDVDLCVRALRFGYRNVVTPYAVLKHHECASRPRRDNPGEVENLKRSCFGPNGWTDPYYHPALNRAAADFALGL